MAFDLNDAWGWIQKLISRVSRLESGAMLENSSITNGRMRFIGGTLRVDSGGRLELEGTLEGGGTFIWTGTLTNNGPLVQNGTWKLNGAGEIAGNAAILPGGTFTVQGAQPIVLSVVGGTARMAVGSGYLAGVTNGVAVVYPSGGQIVATSAGASVLFGSSSVSVSSDGVDIQGDVHMAQPDPLPSGVTGKYLIIGSDGNVYTGSAGGGGGTPGDPPAGNPDGYIWPADPAVYGISDDFAAHVARGSAEPGVDVMTPVGTPLWSPANGTIVDVQTSPAGATGRYITLVTTEGDWFRFLHNSSVVVTSGQTVTQTQLLGYTGGSGFGSEAYYGPHTHISFSRGYSGSFPGASAMDDFQAYMAAA